MFAGGDPDEAFDYYLRLQTVDGRRFQPLRGEDFPFTRRGLNLALRDLRQVILAARAGGRRKVILGGHSLGASTAVAYSTWDFSGRPGYEDVDGLVLIDGGLKGTFTSPTSEEAKQRYQELQSADPFVDLLGIGLPWAAGAFAESAALYARKKPNQLSRAAAVPTDPARVQGAGADHERGGPGLRLRRDHVPGEVRADPGQGRATGAERQPPAVANGEVTPIQHLAQTFATEPGNGIE